VALSLEDQRGLWRYAWLAAPDGANTFREQLEANFLTLARMNAAGSVASVAKNSVSHAAAFGGASTLTTVDLQRGYDALLQLYARLASDLSSSDEQTIYDEGLVQLSFACTEAFGDITNLRCA
jgi:hypothetical protein